MRIPLTANRDAVRRRVARACDQAGRSPDDVRIVAVTKTVTPAVALELAALGEHDLGENRAPDFLEQVEAFRAAEVEVRWHFIGHLQRNKARRVARAADSIHSVDSPTLLETLARIGDEEQDARPELFLQVKLRDEPAKHGFPAAEIAEVVSRAADHGHRLAGLMAMAPLVRAGMERELDAPLDPAGVPARGPLVRAIFGELAELAATLDPGAFIHGRPLLSMGMSTDLEEAIAAGADLVRIGSAFFEGIPRRPGRVPRSTAQEGV